MPADTDSNRPSVVIMAVAALGWAMAGALGWSLFDARPLAEESGVAYVEAWTAASFAGLIVAVALLPAGLVAGWLWHYSRWGDRLKAALARRPADCGALVVAFVVGWVLLSYGTYGALALYRDTFGSELVHKLALSLSVPAMAAGAALVTYLIFGPIRSLLKRIDEPWQILAISALTSVALITAWSWGLIELGKVVWQNLTPWIYVPFALIGLASILGALAADVRRARQVTAGAGLVLLSSAGFYLLGQPSQDLRLAIAHRQSGTGLISEITSPDEVHGFAAAEANRGQSAVCFPETDPPKLGDVGHAGPDAPDIIWLTIDAIRWDHTSLSDYDRDTTPNIARHAKRAAVFEEAYTPASSTRQTMRSLFTGVYPSMIDPPVGSIYALTIADEQHTLAEFLRHAGYHTSALSSDGYIFSQDHGAMQGFVDIDEKPYELKDTQGYAAPYTVDKIIDRLEDGTGPRFVWSHIIEPHAPFLTGPDPIDFGDEEIDRYDAAIHFVDDELDRLLEYVAERQKEHPTYLVITADHGEAFGEHGQRRHGYTIYQEETRVPLIFWGPDIVADRYDEPVGVIDLYPTFFELAGLNVPRGSCGESLADVLRSEREPDERPVYLEQIPDRSRTHFSVGFVRGDEKLVLNPTADAVSLFDHSTDPEQFTDLAADKPDRVDNHLDALVDYWQRRGMDPSDYRQGE